MLAAATDDDKTDTQQNEHHAQAGDQRHKKRDCSLQTHWLIPALAVVGHPVHLCNTEHVIRKPTMGTRNMKVHINALKALNFGVLNLGFRMIRLMIYKILSVMNIRH
jgi:hypothetical protein